MLRTLGYKMAVLFRALVEIIENYILIQNKNLFMTSTQTAIFKAKHLT